MVNHAKTWLKDDNARRSGFPNISENSLFSAYSQVIAMPELSQSDLDVAAATGDLLFDAKVQGAIAHEATHWGDLVGTTWGRQHLRQIFGALKWSEDPNKTDHGVWRIFDVHDAAKRLQLRNHQSSQQGFREKASLPWLYNVSSSTGLDTSGRVEHDRPMLLMCYQKGPTRVAELPLSISSLLEVGACAAQFKRLGKILMSSATTEKAGIKNELSRIAAWTFMEKHSRLATAFHCCHGIGQVPNLHQALDACGLLANLCLNLCEHHFAGLRLPHRMSTMSEHLPIYVTNQDRTFAYAVVCANLADVSYFGDLRNWIDAALDASGLPKSDEILNDALASALDEAPAAANTTIEKIERYQLDLGAEVLKERNSRIKTGVNAAQLPSITPPVYGKDGVRLRLGGAGMDASKFDADLMIKMDLTLSHQINYFVDWLR